jgi:hypothetical protein
MSTYSEIIDEVLHKLAGYGLRNDVLTHIINDVSSTATQIQVASAANIGRGTIEIDDEILWIDTYDRNNNTVTVPPYGRGYMNTTASSHTAGTKVVVNPVFSRSAVKKALNDTLRSVSSKLYAVKTHSFTYNPAVSTYALPADFDKVIAISFETIGATKEWWPIRKYRTDKSANPGAFGSRKSISLYSHVDVGSTVHVTYSSKPDFFESANDDFESATGLPDTCEDVVVLGAVYNLLSFVEAGRLQYVTPEAAVQSDKIQYGSGTNTSKYVYALYQQRLNEERERLLTEYPVRVRYSI